jgi:hypothetical protein
MTPLVAQTTVEPDVDAFMGGLEVAVTAGAVVLIALVVVLAIRRIVSF